MNVPFIKESEVIIMPEVRKEESIPERKLDADELIRDVLKKIPDAKKVEVLRILEGFALNESVGKKVG